MSTFAIDVKKFVSKAEDRMEGLVRAIVIELFTSVIMDTPVDTGRLRGNWQISIREPKTGTVNVTDPSGGNTVKKVEDLVAGADISASDIQFFLSNNLPYASRIEFDGYSKQAPEGMVRRNMIRISNNLKNNGGL